MSEMTELVDKNIERLVEAVKAAGPSAEYAFTDTLANISLNAWGHFILVFIAWFASILALLRAVVSEKKIDGMPVEIFGWLFFALATLFCGVIGPDVLAKALHPVGYLVLKTLN